MGCEPPAAFQYSMVLSIARSIRACFKTSRGKSYLWVRVLVQVCATRSSSVQVILDQHHLNTPLTHPLDHLDWCILLSDDVCESFMRTKDCPRPHLSCCRPRPGHTNMLH
jgi:hypothetical protein